MTRLSKFLLLFVLIVFVLACNFIPQQVKDVQNLAGTAESIATSFPLETVQALASAIPIETIQAGIPTDLPNLDEYNYFDPQGTPLTEWNGIPIMPQATAGEENDPSNYSYKADATAQEVSEYYANQMAAFGWSTMVNMSSGEGGFIVLSKDDQTLTITITVFDGETVVLLTLA